MGVSWKELRDVCQRPVRATNDVAGLLFGDHASLPFTKLLVDLRLSPTYASIGFLICGLLGAALQVLSGPWAVLAAVLMVLYYVLDCVDGEVARFQRVVDVHWGYFDYLFHMLIKPLTFFGIGLGAYRELGGVLFLCFAFTAAVATLWRKILIEIPGILFLRAVLAKSAQPETAPAAGRVEPAPAASNGDSKGGAAFRLRFDLVTLRAVLTNFDVGLLALLVTSVADACSTPMTIEPFGTVTFRALWLTYYGIVLPLDFLDYLVTYLRRRHFSTEMTRLLSLAHHFRADSYAKR